MSLQALSAIAQQRDKTRPQRTKKKPANAEEAKQTQPSGYTDVLVAAIPTEPLALYTALVGGIVATIDPGETQRLDLRWTIYAVGIVFIAAFLITSYRRSERRKRRLPVAEIAAAVVAFAAWGLVMPGSPLSAELSGDDRTVATLVITFAGVGVLLLLGVPLKEETK